MLCQVCVYALYLKETHNSYFCVTPKIRHVTRWVFTTISQITKKKKTNYSVFHWLGLIGVILSFLFSLVWERQSINIFIISGIS